MHHLFVQLVKHMSAIIAREGAHLIEFTVVLHPRTLGIAFWEGKQFECMPIVHCGRIVSPTKRYVDLMSRLLTAIPRDATVICCGGRVPTL